MDEWMDCLIVLRRIVAGSGQAYWQVYQDIRVSRGYQRTSTLERLLVSQLCVQMRVKILLITKVCEGVVFCVLFEFLLQATKDDEVEKDSTGVMAEIQWCDVIDALRKAV
jgi:hypothetical protein